MVRGRDARVGARPRASVDRDDHEPRVARGDVQDVAHVVAGLVGGRRVDVGDGRVGVGESSVEEQLRCTSPRPSRRRRMLHLDDLVDERQVLGREGHARPLVLGHLAQDAAHVGQVQEVRLDARRGRWRRARRQRLGQRRALRGEALQGREERRVRLDVGVGELASGAARVRLLGVQDRVVTQLGPRGELRVQHAAAPGRAARQGGQPARRVGTSAAGDSARSAPSQRCRGWRARTCRRAASTSTRIAASSGA